MAAGVQPGVLCQVERPQNVRDGTLALEETALPGTVCVSSDLAALRYAQGAGYVLRAWGAAQEYAPEAILRRTGRDFYEAIEALLPSLLTAAGGVVATTALGAVVGAGVGALAGGVGAAPGAVAGGEVGLDVGLWLLNWLGVGFLVLYVGEHVEEAGEHLEEGAEVAWDSCGSPTRLDVAAREMAEGIGVFMSLLLQAVIAYIAKEGMAVAAQRFAKSGMGEAFMEFLRKNRALAREVEISRYLEKLGNANAPVTVRQRVAVAVNFLLESFADGEVLGYLKGIDFSKPVEVVTLQPGEAMFQYSNGRVGNWFAKRGIGSRNLGISDAGRERLEFRVSKPTRALKSTAAATGDTWTRGRAATRLGAELVDGGGAQFVIPKGAEQLSGAVPLRPRQAPGKPGG